MRDQMDADMRLDRLTMRLGAIAVLKRRDKRRARLRDRDRLVGSRDRLAHEIAERLVRLRLGHAVRNAARPSATEDDLSALSTEIEPAAPIAVLDADPTGAARFAL